MSIVKDTISITAITLVAGLALGWFRYYCGSYCRAEDEGKTGSL